MTSLRLKVVGELPPEEWEIGPAGADIGRSRTVAVHLPHPSVTRRHAQVQRLPDGTFTVQDLGSTNGTFLNDRPVASAAVPLADGDQLLIGGVPLQVEIGSAPPALTMPSPGALGTIQVGLDEVLASSAAAATLAEAHDERPTSSLHEPLPAVEPGEPNGDVTTTAPGLKRLLATESDVQPADLTEFAVQPAEAAEVASLPTAEPMPPLAEAPAVDLADLSASAPAAGPTAALDLPGLAGSAPAAGTIEPLVSPVVPVGGTLGAAALAAEETLDRLRAVHQQLATALARFDAVGGRAAADALLQQAQLLAADPGATDRQQALAAAAPSLTRLLEALLRVVEAAGSASGYRRSD